MQPPILDFQLQAETLADGVTQSELSLFDECAIKWNLRYNNRLTRADYFVDYFYIGHAWHVFQEEWRKAKGDCDLTKCYFPAIPKTIPQTTELEKTIVYWNGVMPSYQQTYASLYREEAKHPWMILEKELQAEYLGVLIRGKIDLASDKPRFIRDFKSTASTWLIAHDGWNFKLQFMLYCWLMVKNYPDWGEGCFRVSVGHDAKTGVKRNQSGWKLGGAY